MADAIAAIGPGYKIPTYHNLRVNLLRDAKKEVQLLVDSYKKTWEDVRCTLMVDGWIDNSHRSLINFLVYCPKGVCFVKSVDASNVVKDAATLFGLFEEIVLWVGPNNIVHLVTDNGANYKTAGRMLSEKYSSITWSPCAAHCINLMLKDMAEMSHIVNLSTHASEVTKFVYNHSFVLALLRKKQGMTEIISLGATCFATTFIALSSLHQHKHDLQSTVTDRTFVECRYAKTNKGKAFISIVLDNQFSDDIGIVSKVVSPLMHMVRILDSDERSSIEYVYDGMYKTRMGIKKLFKNKKILYKPYTTIIKMRWDRMLRRDLHAAAYYLNPTFKYDEDTFSKKPEVMYGFLDTIDNKASAFKMSKTTLLEESRLYRDRLESFSRELVFQTCKTTRPDEWWRTFRFSTPNLQKFAIKILSQTSASSGYGGESDDHHSYYDSTDVSEDDVAMLIMMTIIHQVVSELSILIEDGVMDRLIEDHLVYKLDEEMCEWVEVEDGLEDRVFFLGDDCSFSLSAKEFSGCKGKSIYFKHGPSRIDGFLPGIDGGIFDLKDRTVRHLFAECSKIFWPPPSWVK
ncbi:uncharacterized protein LOC116145194 [Pistacia vera]|uniref:uncharacterized protein LOC116145194 n=1 Tax=Pistacia vera TaxID=55513 RepID=UPI001263295B|nr:uncharacterized protein LOC116145194 [Pistacia vera]